MDWQGVFPAITTPFRSDGTVDLERMEAHVSWLIDCGCHGIVPLGSLGEGATLESEEKGRILESCQRAAGGRVPVVAAIAGLSTRESVDLARRAEAIGCAGLMVLPPYVYPGEWREIRTHFQRVISATSCACMLYNNPVAYGTDVRPEQMTELAELPNLESVKESSTDVRRVTAIRAVLGDRLAVFVGVDDVLVEGVVAGAVGWIAGLVNAFPVESVRLFELARSGRLDEARPLYEWFLPLLRLDTVPAFVQLIKLVQSEVDGFPVAVRAPRLQLEGAERERVLTLIRERLRERP